MTREQLIVVLDTILGEQTSEHLAWMSETENNIADGGITLTTAS